jgi:penicillin-binding protein-related factor A (putative recombinase)
MSIKQSESNARKAFEAKSQGIILVLPVENMLSEAMSDSMCINRNGKAFWIEFKHLDEWPKRAMTLPLRSKFERGQIPFLKQWQSWRGLGYVLLKAEGEYYLLMAKGVVGVTKDLNEMNKEELIAASRATGLSAIVKYLGELH